MDHGSGDVKHEDEVCGCTGYTKRQSKPEDMIFPPWYGSTGGSASTSAKQRDVHPLHNLHPTSTRSASQLRKLTNLPRDAKKYASFLHMIDSRPQSLTSFNKLTNLRKTRNRAIFEDEQQQDNDVDVSEDECYLTTVRMNKASLGDRTHQETSSHNTTLGARESKSKPQSRDGEQSLNKIFDDCLCAAYNCAYNRAREELLSRGSGENQRTKIEAKVGA